MRTAAWALPLVLISIPAMAQERSKHLARVVDCRKIADPAQRLACYDAAVAELDAAEQKKEVVVVDKEQVREARRSVFGLALPRIKLFGDDKDDIDEIESTVRAISYRNDGTVFFVLEDGARWVQTDDKAVVGVKAGTKVLVHKGAFGSFFAKFKGGIGIKVARVN